MNLATLQKRALANTNQFTKGSPIATRKAADAAEAATHTVNTTPSLSGHRTAAYAHYTAADHHAAAGNPNQEAYHRKMGDHHASAAAGNKDAVKRPVAKIVPDAKDKKKDDAKEKPAKTAKTAKDVKDAKVASAARTAGAFPQDAQRVIETGPLKVGTSVMINAPGHERHGQVGSITKCMPEAYDVSVDGAHAGSFGPAQLRVTGSLRMASNLEGINQYSVATGQLSQHPLIGKQVKTNDGKTGTVTHVHSSRFGPLAVLDNNHKTAYAVHALKTLIGNGNNQYTKGGGGTHPKHPDASYDPAISDSHTAGFTTVHGEQHYAKRSDLPDGHPQKSGGGGGVPKHVDSEQQGNGRRFWFKNKQDADAFHADRKAKGHQLLRGNDSSNADLGGPVHSVWVGPKGKPSSETEGYLAGIDPASGHHRRGASLNRVLGGPGSGWTRAGGHVPGATAGGEKSRFDTIRADPANQVHTQGDVTRVQTASGHTHYQGPGGQASVSNTARGPMLFKEDPASWRSRKITGTGDLHQMAYDHASGKKVLGHKFRGATMTLGQLRELIGNGNNQYTHSRGDFTKSADYRLFTPDKPKTGGKMPFESAWQKRSSSPTAKDAKRISDIVTKSDGNPGKAHDLARQMANAITDPMKAKRRGRAADSLGHTSIATIFHERHQKLVGRAATRGGLRQYMRELAAIKTLARFNEGDAVVVVETGKNGFITSNDDGEYDVEDEQGDEIGTFLASDLRAAGQGHDESSAAANVVKEFESKTPLKDASARALSLDELHTRIRALNNPEGVNQYTVSRDGGRGYILASSSARGQTKVSSHATFQDAVDTAKSLRDKTGIDHFVHLAPTHPDFHAEPGKPLSDGTKARASDVSYHLTVKPSSYPKGPGIVAGPHGVDVYQHPSIDRGRSDSRQKYKGK